jgi:LPXTG-motif cell wall-anchored protein
MMHRGLARVAVAAGAVLVGAAVAATPAVATDVELPGVAGLNLATVPTAAKDFNPKGCDGIPGGAKAGTDGWVFSQPVDGATDYGYIFGFANGDGQPVVLGVGKEGVTGLQVDPSEAAGLKAGRLSSGDAKALAQAVEDDAPSGDVEEVPAPAGVAGGLTSTGEGWLQTPAGWQLVYGALLYSSAALDSPKEFSFSLLRVCAPKADTAPAPTDTATAPAPAPSKAPGAGGGSGGSLPVTGANAGLIAGAGALLIGIGAVLFVRRRRETTKFVA